VLESLTVASSSRRGTASSRRPGVRAHASMGRRVQKRQILFHSRGIKYRFQNNGGKGHHIRNGGTAVSRLGRRGFMETRRGRSVRRWLAFFLSIESDSNAHHMYTSIKIQAKTLSNIYLFYGPVESSQTFIPAPARQSSPTSDSSPIRAKILAR